MSSASPAQTSSMWSTGFRSCCLRCRRTCRPAWMWWRSPTAPPRFAPRSKDVEFELVLAVVLVVLVIWLFLRNIPATIIPSLSVPLSLIGTFAVMYLAGFSLNNLSLMALTIATGFVVDDAIVMIENIFPLYRSGRVAARSGAEGRRANRLHHHFADRIAHRGADSAAVHAGRGRAIVSRIRRHAGRDHPDFRGGFFDAGADDVREAAQASLAKSARADRIGQMVHRGGRLVWPTARRGCSIIRRLTLWVATRHFGFDLPACMCSFPRDSSRSRTRV